MYREIEQLFKDFTKVSCGMCDKHEGKKDCKLFKCCLEKNKFTVKELYNLGWRKSQVANS